MVLENVTATYISSLLTGEILDRVIFDNTIMKYGGKRTGDQNLHYKLEHWKKIVTFHIPNNISKYINLVQLMDSVGNVNHAVSVAGKRIFNSNYKSICC